MRKVPRRLVIPDLHIPFQHPKAFEFLRYVQKEYNCTLPPVQIGDMFDKHAENFHGADPDGLSSGDELRKTMETTKEFRALFPKGTCVLGNHDLRPERVLFKAGLSKKYLKEYSELYKLPGWDFLPEYIVDGVRYIHIAGGGKNPALAAAERTRISTVSGHLHSVGGIMYSNNGIDTVFGAMTGGLTDEMQYAFEYAKSSILKNVYGCVIIESRTKAFFVPMEG